MLDCNHILRYMPFIRHLTLQNVTIRHRVYNVYNASVILIVKFKSVNVLAIRK